MIILLYTHFFGYIAAIILPLPLLALSCAFILFFICILLHPWTGLLGQLNFPSGMNNAVSQSVSGKVTCIFCGHSLETYNWNQLYDLLSIQTVLTLFNVLPSFDVESMTHKCRAVLTVKMEAVRKVLVPNTSPSPLQ